MALEEISGAREARRLLKEYREQEKSEPKTPMRHANEVAGPGGGGSAGVVGEGTDGIDLDPAEVAEAERRLGELYAEIAVYKAQAEDLSGPLGDGSGPVALHMRKAFGLRGSDGIGGVHLALQQYLTELAGLREAVAAVGVVHQASEDAAVESMRVDEQGV